MTGISYRGAQSTGCCVLFLYVMMMMQYFQILNQPVWQGQPKLQVTGVGGAESAPIYQPPARRPSDETDSVFASKTIIVLRANLGKRHVVAEVKSLLCIVRACCIRVYAYSYSKKHRLHLNDKNCQVGVYVVTNVPLLDFVAEWGGGGMWAYTSGWVYTPSFTTLHQACMVCIRL